MDPDFIEEKFAYISALNKVEEEARKKQERDFERMKHRR